MRAATSAITGAFAEHFATNSVRPLQAGSVNTECKTETATVASAGEQGDSSKSSSVCKSLERACESPESLSEDEEGGETECLPAIQFGVEISEGKCVELVVNSIEKMKKEEIVTSSCCGQKVVHCY